MFTGRTLIIATKHQKEKVIAPILERELGVKCIVPGGFDTDALGTFTGEIERIQDPLKTARLKCELSLELTGYDLALSSEGSFGPHPTLFFISSDEELLFLLDKRNNLEISVRELSTNTNLNGAQISSEAELWEFAEKAKFPEHGLILRQSEFDYSSIVKGITSSTLLMDTFNKLKVHADTVYIETDMRALYNPTRMEVIERATEKLVEKIKSVCPACKTPGFAVTAAIPGLPCERCRFPTRSASSHVYTCQKCSFVHEKKFPAGRESENPMHCDNCNP